MHEITQGTSWFYKTPAWHRLGLVDDTPRSPREAFRLAKADYEVFEESLYSVDGEEIEGYKRIMSDTGYQLSVQSESYQVLQNDELIKVAEALGDQIEMSAVVVLRNYKRVSFTAEIKRLDAEVVRNDRIKMRLVGMTGHDGRLAFQFLLSPIRVVCSNTLAQCLGIANDATTRTIRHTANAQKLIAHLPEIMNLAERRFDGGIRELQALAAKPATRDDLNHLLELTFADELKKPINDERGKPETARPRRLDDLACYASVHKMFAGSGIGLDQPGVRGTLYAAEQAVAQFYSHNLGAGSKDKAAADARRYESLMVGPASDVLDRAHQAALRMSRT